MKISAIVLNWNRKNDTMQCLMSLQRQRDVQLDIIVVDNASSDDSVQAIARHFPKIHLIMNSLNLGYAGGNNVGIEHALRNDSEFILVLNNDTILDPDCVIQLVADLKTQPDAAAASPKSYYFDAPETIYFAGGKIAPDGTPLHVGGGQPDGPEFQKSGSTDWLTGCAILFRNEALQKVGLFDPRYYLLFEDVDWSLRAKKAGYELRFVSGAKLWHKISTSFGRLWSPLYLYYYTRNACLWIECNFPLQRRASLCIHAFRRSMKFAQQHESDAVRGHSSLEKRAVWQGIFDYIVRRFGAREYPWLTRMD